MGEPEGGAVSRIAPGSDHAAHQLDKLLADREPEAGPAISPGGGGIGLRKLGEQLRLRLRRDADAGIGDLDSTGAGLTLSHLDQDVTVVRELDGVAHEVDEHLPEARAVADPFGWCGAVPVQHQGELASGCLRGEQVHHLGDDFAGVELPMFESEFAGFDFRVVENVVD